MQCTHFVQNHLHVGVSSKSFGQAVCVHTNGAMTEGFKCMVDESVRRLIWFTVVTSAVLLLTFTVKFAGDLRSVLVQWFVCLCRQEQIWSIKHVHFGIACASGGTFSIASLDCCKFECELVVRFRLSPKSVCFQGAPTEIIGLHVWSAPKMHETMWLAEAIISMLE